MINIELKGADHSDFNIESRYTGSRGELNRKAAQFNVFVTKRAYDIDLLKRDLQGMSAVTPTYKNGQIVKYEVDLSKFNIEGE
jgi:hypothetical protein